MRITLTKNPNSYIRMACFLMGALLCLRAVKGIFLYPALLFGGLLACFSSLQTLYPILLFILPFGNIFKTSPGSISFFTFLFLIYIVRVFFERMNFPRKLVLSLFLFAEFSLLVSGASQLITVITMICGFLMIYETCTNENYSFIPALYAFAAGISLASLLAVFKDQLPILGQFVMDVNVKLDTGYYGDRFSGLHGNPNWYTMDISVVLACFVSLISTSRARLIDFFFIGVLSIFGFMSLSKSFLLVWVLLMMVLMFASIRAGGSGFVKILLALLVVGGLLFCFAGDSITLYIARLNNDSGESLNAITTGRSEIWLSYLYALTSDLKLLFLGNGINGVLVNGRSEHNTYLQILYSLGVVGTLIYTFALKASIVLPKGKNSSVWLWCPVLVLLVRFCALSALTYDNIPYYYSLICLMFVCNRKSQCLIHGEGECH